MASKNQTKINIDKDLNEVVSTLAAGKGLSARQMLEVIILFYLKHNK